MIQYLTAVRDCEMHDGHHPVGNPMYSNSIDHGLSEHVAGGIASAAQALGYVDIRGGTVALTWTGFDAVAGK